MFAIGALIFAGRPADRNHPYGHGKMEFLSAAFEGGLIAFAALVILYEVVQSLIHGVELRSLDLGLAIVLGAGLVNLALGYYLVRAGRRYDSLTLIADGRHVLADFYTSAGIVVGLLLVRITGLAASSKARPGPAEGCPRPGCRRAWRRAARSSRPSCRSLRRASCPSGTARGYRRR